MKRPRLLANSLVLTVIVAVHFNLICSSGIAGPKRYDFTKIPANALFTPDELLVRFAPKTNGNRHNLKEKEQILNSLAVGNIDREFRGDPDLVLVKIPPGLSVQTAIDRLYNAQGITYTQPNYIYRTASSFPNDTRFDELWGMHNTGQTGGTMDADIDAPEAWNMIHDANDIIVAVIDTGVNYSHPDLAANMWVNEAELNGDPNTDDDGNGYKDDIYGYDFCTYGGEQRDSDPNDDRFHGTHVAGTIGAVGSNALGVTGVCWNINIMAIKYIGSSGSGHTADALDSIKYAVDNGAKIINASWGGYSFDPLLKQKIEWAGDQGVLFVAAAGNDNKNTGRYPFYPASYDLDNIISVMATDQDDLRVELDWWDPDYWASNWGAETVDLAAPGVEILSTMPTGETDGMDDTDFRTYYDFLDGTSMAAPHVAGACALVWAKYPNLTHLQVKQVIMDSVEILPGLFADPVTGKRMCVSAGRLNLHNAVRGIPDIDFWITDDVDPNGIDPTDPNDRWFTYTIHYSGHPVTDPDDPNYFGPLENARITDILPGEVTYPITWSIDMVNFQSVCSDPNYSEDHTYMWDIGTIEPGTSGSVKLRVYATTAAEPMGVITNTAVLTSDACYVTATIDTPVACFGGDIIYVDRDSVGPYANGTSWAWAYTDLQDALARARKNCGNEIWIAGSDYAYKPAPAGDTNGSFELVDGVAIYGGFAGGEGSLDERDYVRNETVLSGNIDTNGDDDCQYVVTYGDFAGEGTILDGVVVTGAVSAGIYCAGYDPADPNRTDFFIQPVIKNCLIANNAGDGIYSRGSDPDIINCVISENNGYGIYDCNDTTILIDRCVITKNAMGGVRIGDPMGATITNSSIHNNGGDGVVILKGNNGVIIRNDTIAYNADYGINVDSGQSPEITSCIVWGNGTAGLGNNCSASYSCFSGGSGSGNRNSNPEFASSDPNMHYHLAGDSPCRDAGDPDYVAQTNETDIDGHPRVVNKDTYTGTNARVDMGADEVWCTQDQPDFNCDGFINFSEFAMLSEAWLTINTDSASDERFDFHDDPNDVINALDLALFAPEWGEADWRKAGPSSLMATSASEMTVEESTGGAGTNSADNSQSGQRQAGFLTLQQQARQLAENIALLEWLWAYDEDINTTIDQDQWLDFISSVYDTLDELQSQ